MTSTPEVPDDHEPSGTRKPPVDPGVFATLDLRVGRVVDAAVSPGARPPAFRLRVDFGPEVGVLQTSARVTNYALDALPGRTVVGVINLGVRLVAGFRSEFLLLGAVAGDGSVRLLEVDASPHPGTPVA